MSGHRVKLHALMTCYRQRGSVDEVLQAFPTLSREVVEEVLEFAARKPDIVESILDEEEQRLREAAAQVDQGPSLAELRRRVPA
ncbi:MAG: DUF433 domain-containing protein [Planctomycetes bacterium]|nr:DUF433 domain-containing protein [Planctomycetota bacterium]